MIRILLYTGLFLFLLVLQVSFVFSLPYPMDRIPLIIVVVVYLSQYGNTMKYLWWLPVYGLLLDTLQISLAPFEVISYLMTAFLLGYLVTHIFTNKSFYGMAASSVACLFCLTLLQLTFVWLLSLTKAIDFLWTVILYSSIWSILFSVFALLFLFPMFHRIRLLIGTFILERF